MATNYNVNDDPYSSTVQMENSEYAVAVKPSLHAYHPIECASDQRRNDPFYVYDSHANTSGAVADKRFRDMGKFQIATEGLSTTSGVTIGQLWVTYEIEFLKPILPYRSGPPALAGFWTSPNYTVAGSWTDNIAIDGIEVDGVGSSGGIKVTLQGYAGRNVAIMYQCLGAGIVSQSTILTGLNASGTPGADMLHSQASFRSDTAIGHGVFAVTADVADLTVTLPASGSYNGGWVYVYLDVPLD